MKKVLVVGAGPVGLTMAAELARHGVNCQIVEKRVNRSPYCKALGVTPRTLEVWEDMGIVQQAIQAGIWIKGRQLDVPGKTGEIVLNNHSDLPYSSLSLPQYETERILADHLNHFGISIRRGISVTEMKPNDRHIDVTLAQEDGTISSESYDYVVGCDGAHSTVRQLSGIGFQGEMVPYEFMLADVKIDWDLPRGIVYSAIHPVKDSAPDFFYAVPLPEQNRYRISTLADAQIKPGDQGTEHGIQSERPAPALESFQLIVDRMATRKLKLSDARWSSIFRISMRLATNYRKGNIFIAGDAAHIHPPTGGQGMNTGIQDAYNLAWKMALVCNGLAEDKILDSYENERQEEGLNVINRTVAATMNFGKGALASDRLTDAQMLVSYRNSSLILKTSDTDANESVQAGDRAPDCKGLCSYGFGFPFRLFDVFKGTQHSLLIDAGDNLKALLGEFNNLHATLLNKFGAALPAIIKIVIISSERESESPVSGVMIVYDPEKLFASTYHSNEGSLFIVRPDGYIGWRGANWKDASMDIYLKQVFK